MGIEKFMNQMYRGCWNDDTRLERAVSWEHELHKLYRRDPEEFVQACEQLGIDITVDDFEELDHWDNDWGPEDEEE